MCWGSQGHCWTMTRSLRALFFTLLSHFFFIPLRTLYSFQLSFTGLYADFCFSVLFSPYLSDVSRALHWAFPTCLLSENLISTSRLNITLTIIHTTTKLMTNTSVPPDPISLNFKYLQITHSISRFSRHENENIFDRLLNKFLNLLSVSHSLRT